MVLKRTKLDTIYTLGMKNEESGGIDTLFVNVKDLKAYQLDEMFHQIISSDTTSRTEMITDYLRKKYHLNADMLLCPITKERFIFDIDKTTENPIFTVSSPITDDYTLNLDL